MQQASLDKLDAPTRVKLRSSQILTSLPQLIAELVQNSLDAGATSIHIGVDCEEWLCWVKDDGSGISKDGLFILAKGSEEGRYGMCEGFYTSFSKPELFVLQQHLNHMRLTH
jgi:DNA mismatch repair protein MLH3